MELCCAAANPTENLFHELTNVWQRSRAAAEEESNGIIWLATSGIHLYF